MDVQIKAEQRDGFLCQECDALWFLKKEIAPTGFVDFGTYMSEHGGEGVWDEVLVRGVSTLDASGPNPLAEPPAADPSRDDRSKS